MSVKRTTPWIRRAKWSAVPQLTIPCSWMSETNIRNLPYHLHIVHPCRCHVAYSTEGIIPWSVAPWFLLQLEAFGVFHRSVCRLCALGFQVHWVAELPVFLSVAFLVSWLCSPHNLYNSGNLFFPSFSQWRSHAFLRCFLMNFLYSLLLSESCFSMVGFRFFCLARSVSSFRFSLTSRENNNVLEVPPPLPARLRLHSAAVVEFWARTVLF